MGLASIARLAKTVARRQCSGRGFGIRKKPFGPGFAGYRGQTERRQGPDDRCRAKPNPSSFGLAGCIQPPAVPGVATTIATGTSPAFIGQNPIPGATKSQRPGTTRRTKNPFGRPPKSVDLLFAASGRSIGCGC